MYSFLIVLLSVGLLLSCKEESGSGTTLKIAISPVDNALPVDIGETVTAADGRKFFLSTFRFYLSDITLVSSSGSRIAVKDVFLYKWGSANDITLDIPSGTYDSLVFGLGLSPDLNNSNASSFANSHPLSIAQDMYWPMLKYRFVLMEGAVDTTLDKSGTPNFPVTYHLGSDGLYRRIAVPWSVNVPEGSGTTTVFPIELSEIFDGPGGTIDMRTHFSNHTTDLPKATVMIDNLAAQF